MKFGQVAQCAMLALLALGPILLHAQDKGVPVWVMAASPIAGFVLGMYTVAFGSNDE